MKFQYRSPVSLSNNYSTENLILPGSRPSFGFSPPVLVERWYFLVCSNGPYLHDLVNGWLLPMHYIWEKMSDYAYPTDYTQYVSHCENGSPWENGLFRGSHVFFCRTNKHRKAHKEVSRFFFVFADLSNSYNCFILLEKYFERRFTVKNAGTGNYLRFANFTGLFGRNSLKSPSFLGLNIANKSMYVFTNLI